MEKTGRWKSQVDCVKLPGAWGEMTVTVASASEMRLHVALSLREGRHAAMVLISLSRNPVRQGSDKDIARGARAQNSAAGSRGEFRWARPVLVAQAKAYLKL